MKTSTKVLIAVGALVYLRSRQRATPAVVGAGSTAYAAPIGTWVDGAPVTPTFSGGSSGYGTSPISALFTALLGGNVRATPVPPSASAPGPGVAANEPYEPGAYSGGDGFGQAGVPGTYIDPGFSLGVPVTAADPSILMIPVPYGDGVIWTPSPSVAG